MLQLCPEEKPRNRNRNAAGESETETETQRQAPKMKEEKFKINEQNWFGERRNSTAKKHTNIYLYIPREEAAKITKACNKQRFGNELLMLFIKAGYYH